jgi:hypothetical protein
MQYYYFIQNAGNCLNFITYYKKIKLKVNILYIKIKNIYIS